MQMQELRRFADQHKSGEPINLSSEDSAKLSQGILAALQALDTIWETISGRELTKEEKWGTE